MRKISVVVLIWLTVVADPSEILGQEKFERTEWTTSRFVGSPEPPLPFVLKPVLTDITLQRPTEMIRVPGQDRWAVVEMGGKVVTFSDDPENRELKTLVDLGAISNWGRAYGIVFHPEFPAKPYCFLAYSSDKKSDEGSRLSRFTFLDPKSLNLDPKSEKVLIKWSSTDHCGGSLHFGPDRFLYFSIGDGQRPNPPDPSNTGQDISDLQANILRIDVDHDDGGLGYQIPKDNPFAKVAGARGEIWAFGLRNVWKMCFHPTRGELWAADVGWETNEMIYKIQRGANYGWSVKEGSHVVKLDGNRHNVPITPPTWEYDHTQGRSITGGYFWQSDKHPELKDTYIYGDYISGKIWALKHDGTKVLFNREIAKASRQIICFALKEDGSILSVGYDGVVEEFVINPAVANKDSTNSSFPKKLSETGLFTSVSDQTPAPGVTPYSINAHHWADHTTSEQWFGLPGEATLSINKRERYDLGKVKGYFDFPRGTVFAKTVSYLTDVTDPNSKRRLETQVLHRLDLDWRTYNYIWNDEQTDAILQDNVAAYKELQIKDPEAINGVRKQTWLHASRDQCALCHIFRAGSVNGFRLDQIDRTHTGESTSQIEKFEKLGLIARNLPRPKIAVSPYDEAAPLEDRARRYLDLNCAHCHMNGGGGSATFVLQSKLSLENTKLVDAPALKGSFGIENAKTLTVGHPHKSVLLYRIAKSGPGRMPKFGPNLVDAEGVKLVHDWIASMDETADLKFETHVREILDSSGKEFIERISELLSSTEAALLTSVWCGQQPASDEKRRAIVEQAKNRPAEIRDLFEHFLPADQRTKRLGAGLTLETLLPALVALDGDKKRGEELFFGTSFTCKTCHQVAGRGRMVGPDLGKIGSQRTSEQILRSILQPSAEIEKQYQGILVMTIDGEIKSGLQGKSNKELVEVIDLEANKHVFKRDDVDELKVLDKSIMPEGLLEEFTPQQAADLLAFLQSLKSGE